MNFKFGIFSWIKNYKALIFLSILILLSNLNFLTLPLVKVFGYEFAVVNAVLLCFFSGILRISLLRQKQRTNKRVVSFFLQISILAAIPFLVTNINSVFTGFCSFSDGLLFYLLIPVISSVVGYSLGLLVFHFVKNIFAYPVFIISVLIILSIAVAEIYFNPQIYLYNPVFGYFPGTIYDEGLRPGWDLFIYRFLNLIYFSFVALLFQSQSVISRKIKFIKLIFVLLVGVIFYWITPTLGFSTTHSSLQNELAMTLESENIILKTGNINHEDSLIVLSAEFYYTELQKYFNSETDKKITVYLFNTAEAKKKLFGSGNADVAKPWLNEIYISRQNWESTLRHELAHCFTAQFGSTIFKIASGFNAALIEGAAESADAFYDKLPLHYLAKTAFENGFKTDLEKLFSPGVNFFSQNSGLSYIYAGSFCKYIIEKFGMEKFKQFYKYGFSETLYDGSLKDILNDYTNYLISLNFRSNKYTAEYYFGSPGIIHKYCPRYYEEKLSNAWHLLNNKKYKDAAEIFRNLLSNSNNYSALIGLAISLEQTGDIDSALSILNTNIDKYQYSSAYYLVKIKLADLLIKIENYKNAKEIYIQISNDKPTVRLQLIVLTRLALLNRKPSLLHKYLDGSDYDKYSILTDLNKTENYYFTFPVMSELSESLQEDYQLFLKKFETWFTVDDFWSCYAMISLSEFMLRNFDFINARRIIRLALRYNGDLSLTKYAESVRNKMEWIYFNNNRIFKSLKSNNND